MPDVKLLNDHELVMVDDDEMEFSIAKRYLKKSKLKNDLLTFTSGAAFLEYLDEVERRQRRMPALVLLDVRLPVVSGFDILTEVRSHPSFRSLPVMMMFSNSEDEHDIAKSYELGANFYQVKPKDGEEYIEFLNSLADE